LLGAAKKRGVVGLTAAEGENECRVFHDV
jgi:hypothetical protein